MLRGSPYLSDDSEEGFDRTPRSSRSSLHPRATIEPQDFDRTPRSSRYSLRPRGTIEAQERSVRQQLRVGAGLGRICSRESSHSSATRFRWEEDKTKLQVKCDHLREVIEELEMENEALKSRGHVEAKAESRRQEEFLQMLQQEVQQVRQLYQEAQKEAEESLREAERLRGQVVDLEAQLAEQAVELQESRALLHEHAQLRNTRRHPSQSRQEDSCVAAEWKGLKLADLKEARQEAQRLRGQVVDLEEARQEAEQLHGQVVVLEVERLRGPVVDLQAQLAEQAVELQESRALHEHVEFRDDSRATADKQGLECTELKGSIEPPVLAIREEEVSSAEEDFFTLADLKGIVEPPVFSSMEAVELNWQAFKRLLQKNLGAEG